MSILRLDLTKFLVIISVALAMHLFVTNAAFSQSPSPAVPPVSSSEFAFPIEELGKCSDIGSCTKYCEDPTHYNNCSAFAKKNGFYKLQASVFVSPHPLNREAIKYLKETGLYSYVRILRVDEADDDRDLRKKFGL